MSCVLSLRSLHQHVLCSGITGGSAKVQVLMQQAWDGPESLHFEKREATHAAVSN